jgi:hypothetical protein
MQVKPLENWKPIATNEKLFHGHVFGWQRKVEERRQLWEQLQVFILQHLNIDAHMSETFKGSEPLWDAAYIAIVQLNSVEHLQ